MAVTPRAVSSSTWANCNVLQPARTCMSSIQCRRSQAYLYPPRSNSQPSSSLLLAFTQHTTLTNPVGVMLGCCTAQRAVQWSLLTVQQVVHVRENLNRLWSIATDICTANWDWHGCVCWVCSPCVQTTPGGLMAIDMCTAQTGTDVSICFGYVHLACRLTRGQHRQEVLGAWARHHSRLMVSCS